MGTLTPSVYSLIPTVLSVGLNLAGPKPSSRTAAAPFASGPSAADIAAAEEKRMQEAKAKADEAERKQREKNLLRRDRGLGGTVQTGVKGVLAQSAQTAPKKTLLGQ